MSAIAAFVLGLLIGWVIEWIIDWWYWRRRLSALRVELNQTKSRMATVASAAEGQAAALGEIRTLQQRTIRLEADKTALNQQISALTSERSALMEQLAACQARLNACESARASEAAVAPAATGVGTPTIPVRAAPVPASVQPDDLEIIKGIGPVIHRKLNQGGVYTFEQLAALSPAQLEQIVGEVIQRLADEDSIIAQAKDLAARKAGRG